MKDKIMNEMFIKLRHCPRCGQENVLMHLESLECLDCGLEFELDEILSAPDPESVLSIQEKMQFTETLFFL